MTGTDNERRRRERREAGGRRSDERWQAVLRGAAEVFRRDGFARARLEDVAAVAGVNRATLYYYVGTKDELLVALLTGPAQAMTAHCREARDADLPADAKLVAALRAYVADLDAHPELFLLFSEDIGQVLDGPDRDALTANADAYVEAVAEIVDEGVRAGVFRPDLDRRLLVRAVLGQFNWIHRWYVPGGRRSLDEIGEVFAAFTLGGLTPKGAAMTDTTELSTVVAEYCHRLDDGRFDELLDLFSSNASVEFMGRSFEGEKIGRFFTKIREARAGRHLCANSVFTVDGDSATGLSDYLFVGIADGDPPQAGRYEDRYTREGGHWRIASRRIVPAG